MFADDKMNGHGELKENNGTIYTGEWVKNLKHGKGKIEFKDG